MTTRPYADIPLAGLLARIEHGHFESTEWSDISTEICVHRHESDAFARALAKHLRTMQQPINLTRLAVQLNAFSVLDLKRTRGRVALVDACLRVAEALPEVGESMHSYCLSTLLSQSARLAGPLIFDELHQIAVRATTAERRQAVLHALGKILIATSLPKEEVAGAVKDIRLWIEQAMDRFQASHDKSVREREMVLVGEGIEVLALLDPEGFIEWWSVFEPKIPEERQSTMKYILQLNATEYLRHTGSAPREFHERLIAVMRDGSTPS